MKADAHLAVDARLLGDFGIGVYLRNLLPRLTGLAAGWRFSVIGSVSALGKLPWPPEASVELLACDAPIYSVREQLAVPRRVPGDAHALWVPHFNIPLLYRGRLVVTVHDVLHLARPRLSGARLHRGVYARWMFDALAARAAQVLTVSDFSRSELLRYTAAPPERVHRVYSGVDPSWFETSPQKDGTAPYVIYVGNWKAHKNVAALVEAFAQIADRVPHRLVLAGDHGDSHLDDRGLGARLTVTGAVSDEQLRALVSGADALVLPSLYEGFGLPALEAMACGCPVLASRSGSLPEVCGAAAAYCDATEPPDIAARLLDLLGDSALQDRLRALGRDRARQFTWDACATETLAVLAAAVE